MAFTFDPDKSKVATEILETLRNNQGISKSNLFQLLSVGSNSSKEQFLGLLIVHGYVAIHYPNDPVNPNSEPATLHTSITPGARVLV
jgi:hypothetical protein